ncbi:helix-turn-helix domain-containing protein [uncultured Apibacter sp.]|uniref:winged helix-turn-helix transcriptional regulator n=1 Tax=uncultured Apibacter sp. TaxID=1778616 RepID=UPI0025EC19B2|nr:helix-turn-helix domain-containing protein [uncultured Apibacter sp.]
MRKLTSTNYLNEISLKKYCNAYNSLLLFHGRWKLPILFTLMSNPVYYSEFKKVLPDISDRILSKHLNELVEDKLLQKEKTKNSSLYTLTTNGTKLISILLSLSDFYESMR